MGLQSEGLWLGFMEKIDSYKNEKRPVIFECVNIMPHLAKCDLGFPGIVLIGRSYEETLKRIQGYPRWGNTPHLQEMEAKCFFFTERPHYKEEAEKYGYPVFETAEEAFQPALDLLN